MPISPLTRFTMALALLAFPAAFLWLEDTGKVSPVMTGVSLVLLVAAVFLLVRDGSAFDDRGFHRTRPGGERRALRKTAALLLGMVLAVAAMAAVRGIVLHLGGLATAWGALVVLVPLALFTAAVATGFTLALQRGRPVKPVLLALLVLPVFVYASPYVLPGWKLPGGQSMPSHWRADLTWGGVLGAAGYALAWWLAAARRSWWPALLAAALAGVLLPVFRRMPVVPPQGLPHAEVTVKRHAPRPEPSPDYEPLESKGLRIEGQLSADGLRDGEFVGFSLLADDGSNLGVIRAYQTARSSSWGGGSGTLMSSEEGFESGYPAIFSHLQRRLPGQPEVRWSGDEHLGENWIALPRGMGKDEIQAMPWQFRGVIYRIEHAADFAVSAPGFHPLPDGGSLHVWDMNRNPYGVTLGFRTVWPDDPRHPGHRLAGMSWAFLIDATGRKAAMIRLSNMAIDRALGSIWQDWNADLHYPGYPEGWTREEVLRSRLHLFTARPVSRVEATLPPP